LSAAVWVSPGLGSFGLDQDDVGPRVVWAAGGSLGVAEVANGWQRRGQLSDLTGVSGPWGVVLWDAGAHEFVVATDPLGIQPLFWARTASGRIAVSSRLAALADRDDVDDSLDDEGVVISSFFHLWSECVADRTSFASISRIPWGRALRITADAKVTTVKYWNEHSLPETDNSLTLAECAIELRDRIDAAISRNLADATALGAHVSGGLDSSAVACRANQLLRAAGGDGLLAGYSWSPDDASLARVAGDERALLDAITAAEGFPVRLIGKGDPDGGFGGLDLDRYPWTITTREAHILPKAADDGVYVMLSGHGGDEAASFRGGKVAAEYARVGRFDLIARHSWAAGRIAGVPAARRLPRTVKAVVGAVGATLPGGPEAWTHPITEKHARRRTADVAAALRSEFPAAAAAYVERIERMASARTHREVMINRLTEGYLQERVNSWYQRGQLFAVDYRYPLLDLDVVTAAVGMPGVAFASNGWSRPAFRHAVEGWVPQQVAWNSSKVEPSRFALDRTFRQGPTPKGRDARLTALVDQTKRRVYPLTQYRRS
jgi:asparagine synthase (glutamine-hydrolysing)